MEAGPGWTVLYLVLFGALLVVEIFAIINKKKGDTISEHIWKWGAVRSDSSRVGVWRRRILFLFMAWLVAHFMTGGWV